MIIPPKSTAVTLLVIVQVAVLELKIEQRSTWVLTNCEPASQRVMRVEPASHASRHVSHARQMLIPSPFSFLQLLAAFGYLARVFANNKRGW